MIFVASQRGGGKQLAAHLLNDKSNDVVEVDSVDGFLSHSVEQAFAEAHAMSKGTKCTQYLFSVSLSPPKDQEVSQEVFNDAVTRIENRMGLQGQSKVLVYHTKENRRHLHAVWNRIDATNMKAVNLPFFKDKLMQISKDLYLEHSWPMPKGLIDKTHRNPLNFTRAEWEQAKRAGNDPRFIKAVLRQCWQQSDNNASFQKAMQDKGYALAQGNRRSFVAVDWKGEVYSLSRATGVKAKDLKARLGESNELQSIDEAKAGFDQQLTSRVRELIDEINRIYEPRIAKLKRFQSNNQERYQAQRDQLKQKQAERQKSENKARQARFSHGLKGFWHRITGKHQKTAEKNQREAYDCAKRDQQERDQLTYKQLQDGSKLQGEIDLLRTNRYGEIERLQTAIFSHIPPEQVSEIKQGFDHSIDSSQNQSLSQSFNLSL